MSHPTPCQRAAPAGGPQPGDFPTTAEASEALASQVTLATPFQSSAFAVEVQRRPEFYSRITERRGAPQPTLGC